MTDYGSMKIKQLNMLKTKVSLKVLLVNIKLIIFYNPFTCEKLNM